MEGLPGLPAIGVGAGLPHFPPQLVVSVILARNRRARIPYLGALSPYKHDRFFRSEKKEGFMHDKACQFYMNRIMASFRASKTRRSWQTDRTRRCRSYSHETHRVFMSFVFNNGWHCRFHEGELSKTPISRQFRFRDKRKLYEAARRGHGLTDATSVSELNQAIAAGHGGVWLRLTDEQYSTLTSSGRRSS